MFSFAKDLNENLQTISMGRLRALLSFLAGGNKIVFVFSTTKSMTNTYKISQEFQTKILY